MYISNPESSLIPVVPSQRIMEKSVNEVSSWLTENGFSQYIPTFHGKWVKIIVNMQLSALFIDKSFVKIL